MEQRSPTPMGSKATDHSAPSEKKDVSPFFIVFFLHPGPTEGVEEVVLNPDSHETSTLTYNRLTAARLSF